MSLCIANREQYILVNLGAVTATPILPISQVTPEPGTRPNRPMILAVTEEEFLILSWTGAGTMGVFINLNGDPVRGTLQWEAHPLSISPSLPPLPRHFLATDFCHTGMEYPYVTALLQDQTILVHNVESQEVVQEIPPDPLPVSNEASLAAILGAERRALAMSSDGFLVPSEGQPEKLRLRPVNLLSRDAKPGGREVVPTIPAADNEDIQEHLSVTEDATKTEASVTPYEV